MIQQLVDIDILTPLTLLSSNRLLGGYGNIPFSNIMTLKENVFLSQRELRHDLPDQIHENLIDQFFEDDKKHFFYYIDKAINKLANKYFDQEYIKNELYINWNNILTLVPPLLFSTYSTYENSKSLKKTTFHFSSLPIPNDQELISLTKNKMIETHLHINGTSEMIYNWHYYLSHLDQAYAVLKNSFNENPRLFKQNNINDIKYIVDILKKAKSIFEYVLYEVDFMSEDYEKWNKYLSRNITFDKSLSLRINAKKIYNRSKNKDIIYNEVKFYNLIFNVFHDITSTEEMKKKKDTYSRLLHYYTLAQSFFNAFLVQQLNQYGFSQFQKITDSKLRDLYEDGGVIERYKQQEGVEGSNLLKHLELRFAPKKTTYTTTKLYLQMLNEYDKYKNYKNDIEELLSIPHFSMTTHFIKYKESKNPKYIYIRDSKTKSELDKRVVSIMGLLSLSKPKYLSLKNESFKRFNYLNSIDAAGNELFARPEAFATNFRYIKEQAKKRFGKNIRTTFHAGEDFVHIVSGIRYIYEAVMFLDMQKKDRIGHATALGLSPTKWREQLNSTIVMKKGEYLDNLFFILEMIKGASKYHNEYIDINEKFDKNSEKVYGKKYDYKDYKQFFEHKWMKKKEARNHLADTAFEIYEKYHSISTYDDYHELITINLSEIPDTIIIFIQNRTLALLKGNEIAIESMITSNTRISIYKNFKEHHILSWLQNPNAPDIILASDNPGIFNTNMYLEYFILNQILSDTHFDKKAIIKQLLVNGEEYCFSQNIDKQLAIKS